MNTEITAYEMQVKIYEAHATRERTTVIHWFGGQQTINEMLLDGWEIERDRKGVVDLIRRVV